MTLTDVLMILAIFIGPIAAIQIERGLNRKREANQRKVKVFKTLMITRPYPMSWQHIEALNSVELEFNEFKKGEKEVRHAWQAYFDHLNKPNPEDVQWGVKSRKHLSKLLFEMSKVLGFDFSETDMSNSSYAPKAHFDSDFQNANLKELAIEILKGERDISVKIKNQ